MNKKYGSLSSSQDPEVLATKVKGIILGFSSLIILLASTFFHLQLAASDIISLATEAGMVVGAVATIYGTVIHAIGWWYSRKQVA